MKATIKEILRLTYVKTKRGLPWVVLAAIAVSGGSAVGKYIWNHSQEHRVLTFQGDVLNTLEKKDDYDKTIHDKSVLVRNAKDPNKCNNAIIDQWVELKASLKALDNSCSQAQYTQTGTNNGWVNPADIVEKYLPILKEACK